MSTECITYGEFVLYFLQCSFDVIIVVWVQKGCFGCRFDWLYFPTGVWFSFARGASEDWIGETISQALFDAPDIQYRKSNINFLIKYFMVNVWNWGMVLERVDAKHIDFSRSSGHWALNWFISPSQLWRSPSSDVGEVHISAEFKVVVFNWKWKQCGGEMLVSWLKWWSTVVVQKGL